ncbi:DUF676 domain-containing protein [Madurella fahalii]|uniref:DUF676 domain-containing protein n=1 Tax=Madurella fahalii TaxID=1157608 RepID=A0ABQ0GTC2_9PEZI
MGNKVTKPEATQPTEPQASRTTGPEAAQATKAEVSQSTESGTDRTVEPEGDEAGDLRTLHNPATDGTEQIEIVAVQGLDGDFMKPWRHMPSTGAATMWLRDLLPQKLPNCHTMTFRYDATNVGNMSAHSVRENARKLIRLLRNKRADNALKLAKDDRRLSDIYNSTKGIVFFGTPHRGTEETKWLYLLSDIASTVRCQPPSEFVRVLEPNSLDLLKIFEDFVPLASKYAIVSCYEEHVDRVRRLIVQKMSAVMGLPNEDHAMIGGTHITMCKFGRRDPRFDDVWRSIKRAAEGPS